MRLYHRGKNPLLRKVLPVQLPVLFKRIIVLYAVICILAMDGFSQTVTIKRKNAPLTEIFREVRQQTGFDFFYQQDWLKNTKNVSVDVKNEPLNAVLDKCFQEQPVGYVITGTTIVIKPKLKKSSGTTADDRIEVSGKVTDTEGKPVAGATISVKNADVIAVTEADGAFSAKNLRPDATLVVSGVNIETTEVQLEGRTKLVISVKVKMLDLAEVVVNKGYYKEKQRYSAGNVGRVTAADIEKQPVQNPLLSLQGRVPGLIVTQNSGVAGGGVKVRVGTLQNSIGGGNDPLIVIDGVPYPADVPRTGLENTLGVDGISNPSPLNFINPFDIESIEVLKDADATAIFGSRAGNGAILITTKKGKRGKTSTSVNVQHGWGKVLGKMGMLNTRDYLNLRYEAFRNDGIEWALPDVPADDLKIWDTAHYTDWQKKLIGGTAQYTNANVTLSNGSQNIQYLIGANYNRATTVFPGDFNDQRASLHFNVTGASSNKKFETQFSGNYLVDKNYLPGSDLTSPAIHLPPNAPALYTQDGLINWEPDASGSATWTNPLVDVLYRKYTSTTNNLLGNLILSYDILPGLEVKSSFGYNRILTDDILLVPLEAVLPQNRPFSQRSAQYGNRKVASWIIEPQVNYNLNNTYGELNVTLGATVQQSNTEAGNILAAGFSSDDAMKNPAAATSLTASEPNVSEYKYNGVFGRINYILKKKYFINVTARRDGSSRFGGNNMFHNFGSAGLGWIFSDEKWLNRVREFLNFGKLRFSYGTTGNDQVGDYNFLSLYYNTFTPVAYQDVPGLVTYSLINPYLQWEETKKLQAGIDLGLFNDRMTATVTYSSNRSSNQLLGYNLPSTTGFQSVNSNFPALVGNRSWEIQVGSKIIKNKKISWDVNFNITIPRNKLISFPDLETSSYRNSLVEGQPLQVRKLYLFKEVDPATGNYLFVDSNGRPTDMPDFFRDAYVMANTFPVLYGGFQSVLTYRGFELNFLFQFVKQIQPHTIFNSGSYNFPGSVSLINNLGNMPETVLDRWQKAGDIASVKKYSTVLFAPSYILNSTANVKDASFVRLKNISLSWQPDLKQFTFLSGIKIYFQGQNLWTITDYNGLDPETQYTSVLPPLKTWTFGVQINL